MIAFIKSNFLSHKGQRPNVRRPNVRLPNGGAQTAAAPKRPAPPKHVYIIFMCVNFTPCVTGFSLTQSVPYSMHGFVPELTSATPPLWSLSLHQPVGHLMLRPSYWCYSEVSSTTAFMWTNLAFNSKPIHLSATI